MIHLGIALLIISFPVFSNRPAAQSIYAERDSVSAVQFDAEVSEFLKRAKSLAVKSALHVSLQKLAYEDFLEGKRNDLAKIAEKESKTKKKSP